MAKNLLLLIMTFIFASTIFWISMFRNQPSRLVASCTNLFFVVFMLLFEKNVEKVAILDTNSYFCR